MRLVIFTALFPPLALLVFVMPDLLTTRNFMDAGLLLWMLAWAYMVAVVPAWLTAGVDGLLAAAPLVLRLVMTMAAAAAMAVLSARYGFGQKGELIYFGAIGAIPAAVCSLLSRRAVQGAVPS